VLLSAWRVKHALHSSDPAHAPVASAAPMISAEDRPRAVQGRVQHRSSNGDRLAALRSVIIRENKTTVEAVGFAEANVHASACRSVIGSGTSFSGIYKGLSVI
jgi:hypothetical protein